MTGIRVRNGIGSRSSDGFTLLEVLAAAMIFAMVVTVLIGTSSAGVRRAGVSASRLEASLIAEEELAFLESFLNTQRTPPEDKQETREQYSIRVYSESALEDFASGPIGSPASAGSAPNSGPAVGAGIAAILALEAPGIDVFLRRYEIRVEWIDGAVPETIRRTTYAFDWEGARLALPDLFQTGVEDAAADSGEEGAPGATPRLPTQNRNSRGRR